MIFMKALKWLVVALSLAIGLMLIVGINKWNRLPSGQSILSDFEAVAGNGLKPHISYDDFPLHVRHAIFAAENSTHHGYGVSWNNCIWRYFSRSNVRELGIRSFPTSCIDGLSYRAAEEFLSREYSIRPKWPFVHVMLLGWKMEWTLGRQKVVELILNQSYFGKSAYGFPQAANAFFNKPLSELSISESATLAGLIAAPAILGPNRNPVRSKTRRDKVLKEMLVRGNISTQTYQSAISETLGSKK